MNYDSESERRFRVELRLREVRERLFVTQQELADRAGMSISTISRVENGLQEARISTVRRLALALGVRPDELIAPEDREGNVAA